MKNMRLRTVSWSYFFLLLICSLSPGTLPAQVAKGVRVDVLISQDSSKLEQYAAKQLCHYLQERFGVTTNPSHQSRVDSQLALIVGGPTSNPAAVRALDGAAWPKISDQGIVLKPVQLANKPALIIGGGSERATLWAVYELVERWGVRFLTDRDVFPEIRPTVVANDRGLPLPQEQVVLEPKLAIRQWRVINDFACGPEGWGIADYRVVLDQLAKLKFNRIYVSIYAWQPFLDLCHGGIQREAAWLWYDFHYPLTADMPGRSLFDNRAEFWNPDLPLGASYGEFAKAGQRHVNAIINHAKSRGFEVAMVANVAEFPREFAPLLKDHRAIYQILGNLTITPGPLQPMDDPALLDLAAAVLKSTVNTYPQVDVLVPQMPEIASWTEQYRSAWNSLDAKYGLSEKFDVEELIRAAHNRRGYAAGPERAVTEVKANIAALYLIDHLFSEKKVLADTKRPDARISFSSMAEEVLPLLAHVLPAGWETLNVLDYTPERIVARPEAFQGVRNQRVRHTLIFTLHDDNVGVLPQLNTDSLAKLVGHMRQHGWAGFMTRYWMISDHDPCLAYLSRASWHDDVTLEDVYRDQIATVCGGAAVPDMLTLFAELQEVTRHLNGHGLGLTFPVPSMITKHFSPGSLSKDLVQDREGYRRALAAANMAREKSSDRGRPYVQYWIGRLKFGIGYIDCIEATKQLANAKSQLELAQEKANEAEVADRHRDVAACAEKALQTSVDMLNWLASVARNQSDRGAIAVMGEYVYRPLRKQVQQTR